MKLKTRILGAFILILLLESLLGAAAAISVFRSAALEAAVAETKAKLALGNGIIGRLKHDLLGRLDLIRISFSGISGADRPGLADIISSFSLAVPVDAIVLADSLGRPVAMVPSGIIDIIPRSLPLADFRFPRSEFVVSPGALGPRVWLVTGAPLVDWDGLAYTLLFFKAVDRSLVEYLYNETKTNMSFFLDDVNVCAGLEPFTFIFDPASSPEPAQLVVSGKPALVASIPLAAIDGATLYLVTLRNLLAENIAVRKVSVSYGLIFVVLLALSALLAAALSARIGRPLARLNAWLAAYVGRGGGENATATTEAIAPEPLPPAAPRRSADEIAFLAQTFYGMVRKLLDEETIIRAQLKEISRLNAYNESLLGNLRAGVLVVKIDGGVEFANAYFASLLGVPSDACTGSDAGLLLADYFLADGKPPPRPRIELPSTLMNVSLRDNDPHGRRFVLKTVPVPSAERALLMIEDVTETELAWRSALVAEKIASLGILSGGMAHEINNPLGAILSHVEFLLAVERDPSKAESLGWIRSETRRIAELVRKVLAYSQESSGGERSDADSVLDETLGLLAFEIEKRGIRSETAERAGGMIAIPSNDLKQALFNVVLNAVQAMSGGGILRTSTLRENGIVSVSIQDTGCGIPPDCLDRVCDPFFTTKPAGEGSGLGLFITYGIVRRSGGDLAISSDPGKGTTVELKLRDGED